ncbi:MAG: pilus assembly protein PilM [Deltaproteobacteria bacterium]|nr:pilus assembly protein PilM [Deltaproteobacteria bacterium]
MAQLTLGVDISDDLLSAVVVAGRGRDRQVVACSSVTLEEHDDITEVLPVLLEQLGWQGGRCVSGLPLSYFSLRNLILPFTSEKKIQQILPFELEEYLLVPVDEQIYATTTSGESDDGTRLLVAAVEKRILAHHLDTFHTSDLDPDIVCPSSFALADWLCSAGSDVQDFLLLYGDMGSMTMVICQQGKIVFMRRLSYPEKVFTDAIFSFDGTSIRVADEAAADAAVSDLCMVVQRSIDYFCRTSGIEVNLDHVILAGPMRIAKGFQESIEHELGLPSSICDLVQTGHATLAGNVAESWQPAVYDRPLALALQGGHKHVAFNFRKDEFVAKRRLLGSRRQAMGLALAAGFLFAILFGYLLVDYRSLRKKYDSLAGKMEQVFQESFPDVTRIVDPLVQMRAKLQEAQEPTVSMPLFTQEKRILAILADISARVPDTISMHVSRLVVDQDSVKIKGTTDAFNNVNVIKKVLARSARFSEVNIVSATKAKDRAVIRFEIRLQLGENS